MRVKRTLSIYIGIDKNARSPSVTARESTKRNSSRHRHSNTVGEAKVIDFCAIDIPGSGGQTTGSGRGSGGSGAKVNTNKARFNSISSINSIHSINSPSGRGRGSVPVLTGSLTALTLSAGPSGGHSGSTGPRSGSGRGSSAGITTSTPISPTWSATTPSKQATIYSSHGSMFDPLLRNSTSNDNDV